MQLRGPSEDHESTALTQENTQKFDNRTVRTGRETPALLMLLFIDSKEVPDSWDKYAEHGSFVEKQLLVYTITPTDRAKRKSLGEHREKNITGHHKVLRQVTLGFWCHGRSGGVGKWGRGQKSECG